MLPTTLPQSRKLDAVTLCAEVLTSCASPKTPASLEPVRRRYKDVAACAVSPTQFKKWLRYLKRHKLLRDAGTGKLALGSAGKNRLNGLRAGWSGSAMDVVVHHGTVLARGEEKTELAYR